MNWILANPALLPLAALIALPVLVHLFARSRPRSFQFSSTEFIQKIVRKQMNIKRPQDWLLLLIRTLLVATLITIFLQPVLLSEKTLTATNRHVILIVDATASMNYPEGVQTRFSAACGAASQRIAELAQGECANIIFLKSNPESVFPMPGVNTSHLQDVLRRARCTQETGGLEGALSAAVAQLGKSSGAKEIIVISDFQSSTWSQESFAVPDDIALTRIRIGSGSGVNGDVTSILADPPQPLLSDPVNLLVEVANYSAEEARRTVFLEMPDQRLQQEIIVPPWARATTLFRIKATTAGLLPIGVSLNEDVFTADDRRWMILPVKDHIRVGLYAGDSLLATAWSRALAVLPFVQLQRLTAEELEGDLPYDLIFLAGWSGEGQANLQRQAIAGSLSLICAPKPETAARLVAQLSNASGEGGSAPTSEVLRWQTLTDRMAAQIVAREDRLFTLFTKGNFGSFSSGRVRGHLSFNPEAFPGIVPLIQYADKTPALARLKSTSRGEVYLWNIPLDAAQSDWASKVEFVPLLGELILKGRASGGENPVEELLPGGVTSLKIAGAGEANRVELIGPEKTAMTVERSMTTQGVRLISPPLSTAGLYIWKQKGQVIGGAVVHFPEQESDMRLLEKFKDGTQARQLKADDLLNRPHKESPLWPMFLLIAVALLAFECALAFWIGRKTA